MSEKPKKSWKKASGLVSIAGSINPLSNAATLPVQKNFDQADLSELPVVMIGLDAIERSPFQNRVKPDFETIRALAADIKANGLNNPVLVRPKSEGKYELIAGETRVAAFRMNEELNIPAFVRQMDDGMAACKLVSDNFFHAEMSDWEVFKGLHTVRTTLEREGKALSLEGMAALTPWGKSHVHRLLSFSRLPPVVLQILEGYAEHNPPPLRARYSGPRFSDSELRWKPVMKRGL
jgi:ParB/RepB/Spo0J family partition protein